MTKAQGLTLFATVTLIIAAYWYYFALQTSCGFLHSNIIIANPTFPYMYMRCGLFDVYRFLLISLQSLTGWSYEFMVDILPQILWFPIATVGVIVFYLYRKK